MRVFEPLFAALVLLPLLPGRAPAQPSQTFRCELTRTTAGGLEGPCLSFRDENPAETGSLSIDDGPEADGPWDGVFYIDRGHLPFELVRETLPDGATRLVMRTENEWYLVYEWLEHVGGGTVLVFNLLDQPFATAVDVAILTGASERLERLRTWDREDDRDCENDEPGQASLFCLLAVSVEAALGRYEHRQPALRIVRREIRSTWADRVDNHALMDFNNNPSTTLDDVRAVLRAALERAEREASPTAGRWERRFPPPGP